ncbi:hypothetical protein ACQPZX_23030 [Actinoplanes sp. CA-142083]|uniref:hypothetical protein n=1 Tax=Actinoplanes sp. CA-142083 TaxID=3239903 RepID=UPI003D94CB2E
MWAPVEYVTASVADLLRRAIATLGDERPSPPDPEVRVDSLAKVPVTAQGIVLRADEPVRFADFAPFTRLRSLVIRGKVVSDIAVIATFPALRVPTLNGRQWSQLLAATGLGGSAAVGDAARWSQAFGQAGSFHTLVRRSWTRPGPGPGGARSA